MRHEITSKDCPLACFKIKTWHEFCSRTCTVLLFPDWSQRACTVKYRVHSFRTIISHSKHSFVFSLMSDSYAFEEFVFPSALFLWAMFVRISHCILLTADSRLGPVRHLFTVSRIALKHIATKYTSRFIVFFFFPIPTRERGSLPYPAFQAQTQFALCCVPGRAIWF